MKLKLPVRLSVNLLAAAFVSWALLGWTLQHDYSKGQLQASKSEETLRVIFFGREAKNGGDV
jgi:hypothetical protein